MEIRITTTECCPKCNQNIFITSKGQVRCANPKCNYFKLQEETKK